jgi:hypothetical protein
MLLLPARLQHLVTVSTFPKPSPFHSFIPSIPLPVYYQIFSSGSALPIQQPAFNDDLFIGRVIAIRVPPPHTAVNIKKYLARYEGLTQQIDLFVNPSDPGPVEDDVYVNITAEGPWSTPERPIALVLSEVSG